MTSHEFARYLLELEDLPLVHDQGGQYETCYYEADMVELKLMHFDSVANEYNFTRDGNVEVWLLY